MAISAKSPSPFVSSTFGSHHVAFVDSIAAQWNLMVYSLRRRGTVVGLTDLPRLTSVESGESFGLVWAEYTSIPGVVKQEILLEDVDAHFRSNIDVEAEPEVLDNGPRDTQIIDLTTSGTSDSLPRPARDAAAPESVVPISSALPTALPHAHDAVTPIVHATQRLGLADIPQSVASATNARLASKRAGSPTPIGDRAAKVARTGPREPAAGSLAPIFTRRQTNPGSGLPISVAASSAAPPDPASTSRNAPQQLKLTASERLFMDATGVNPLALRIEKDEEFFLFADLRVELKLRTFEMTPRRIGEITQIYNSRLETQGIAAVKKDPRAIMAALSALEERARERLVTKNFTSSNGSVSFWTKQCSFDVGKTPDPGDTRKASVCKRCLKLRYPNGPGKSATGGMPNHARDCCCDGVHPSLKDEVPWPQPQGVFTLGKHFNIHPFIEEVRRLADALSRGSDLSAAQRSFLTLFSARLRVVEPTETEANRILYFKLLSSDKATPVPGQSELLCDLDGHQHLRIGPVPREDGESARI